MSLSILLYASGHGFGHASRDVQVLQAVRSAQADARLHLRTTVADWFLDHSLAGMAVARSRATLDVGVVQSHSLSQDLDATRQACEALLRRRDALLDAEARFIADLQPDVVLCDIPALPLAAARRVGVRAVAMSNFSWDWIYDGFPGFEAIRDAFAADYGAADLLLRLPFHGGDEATRAFRCVEDVPMVARRGSLPVEEARGRLGIPLDAPVFLISFGGLGPSAFDWRALDAPALHGYRFILTPPIRGTLPECRPANLVYIENARLSERGITYPDLVRACDGVITKPGYGIVSECLANETRILYTERGDFAEYPYLVEGLHRYGVAAHIPNEALESGQWAPYLDALVARPRRPCPLPANGAEVVTAKLRGHNTEIGDTSPPLVSPS